MRIFEGIIKTISNSNTAVIEVQRIVPHPVYKKLIKKYSSFKVDTTGTEVKAGDNVRIVETRPLSRGKFFKIYTDSKKSKKEIKK